MKRTLAGILGLVLVAPAVAQAQAAASSRFRLAGSTLQLAPGEPSGTVTVTVLATFKAADKVPNGQATLTDETPSAAGVKVTAAPVDVTPAQREQAWRFTVKVEGLGGNAKESRTFLLSYATYREKLDYTLTNASPTAFVWFVKAAPEWNAGSQRAFEIPLRIGDVAATNLRLHQVALVSDDKLKHTLGNEHFQLCATTESNCPSPPASLSPRTPYTLYLTPRAELPAGVFKGTVALVAKEKTEPEVLTLTVYSPGGRGWGLFALTLGVLVSLLVQVIVPNFVQQAGEKRAVTMLRERLAAAGREFKQLPDSIRKAAAPWVAKAQDLDGDIGDINGLVRGAVPVPFAQEVVAVETLKAALESRGATLAYLRMLVRDGFEQIVAIMTAFPGHEADGTRAVTAVSLVTQSDTSAEEVKGIVNDLLNGVGAPSQTRVASLPRAAGATSDALRLQIVAASLLVWVVWALLSVVTGAVVLIYMNPGFGTAMDHVLCFAWGAGISLVGQQASQMTPGGVATAIGAKLPGK